MSVWQANPNDVIPLTGGYYQTTINLSWKLDTAIAGQSTTIKRFRLWDVAANSWQGSTSHGIEFSLSGSNTIIDVNPTFTTTQSSNPDIVTVNQSSPGSSSTATITGPNDTVRLFDPSGLLIAVFVVNNFRFSNTAVNVSITKPNGNQNRTVTAQITNVTSAVTPNYAFLVDRNKLINVGGTIYFETLDSHYFTTSGGSSTTLTWTTPSDWPSAPRTFGIYNSNIYTVLGPDWGNDQVITSLNPGWAIQNNQWTLNGSTLSVNIDTGICIASGDEFYIGDAQGNVISNATTHTVTNYTGPWSAHYSQAVSLSGTIPLNTTETYDVYIKGNTATTESKAVNWTSNDSYTYTPPAQYSISNVSWSQSGTNFNDISVSWSETNNSAIVSPGIELHEVGGSSNPLQTTVAGGPFNVGTLTQNKTYKLVYNGSDVNGSTYNAQYTAPAAFSAQFLTPTISNYGATWSIPVQYTNANNQSLSIYIDRQGTQINIYPSYLVNGNSTTSFTDSYGLNLNSHITLQNNDVLKSNHFTNTYIISNVQSPAGTPSYTAGTLTYDNVAGTVTSNISGTANLGSDQIELWVAGSKVDERNTDGPLIYTFNTTPYNTTLGPFNFEVKITGGSATQSLSQAHTTGSDPNPPVPPPATSGNTHTASDYGGRKRRHPIISTQLFNRQRSEYSIGMTHRDWQPRF